MFWITATVVVGILIILSQIESVRTWASRVFGRVAPNVSGWGAAIGGAAKLLSGANVVRLLAIPAVIGGVLFAINYIEGRGAEKVVRQVERQNSENRERIGRAQVGFERDVRETMEAAVIRELEISEEFADVERTILEADSREAIAAAHAAGVARLRERAGARHAAVAADYLSSVGDRPLPSPAGV